MKNKKRGFFTGILNHCYQRTVNGMLLFYCISDYLVLFTVICVTARKYRIRILSLSMMPDHIHHSTVAETQKELSAFVGEYTRKFSLVHNRVCHHKGPLFESPFGSAPKIGAKKARSNLCYVGNNGVERQLCRKAEEYQWGFLAYAISDHPFSEKLVIRKSSYAMRKAVKEVKSSFHNNKPLVYAQLQRLFKPLCKKEKLQLVDFIVSTYNVIDFTEAIRYFDSYEDMLSAMHSNTGSEYDLNEIHSGKSDAHYQKMVAVVMKELNLKDIHDLFATSEEERTNLFFLLLRKTQAIPEQIAKFLRIKNLVREV